MTDDRPVTNFVELPNGAEVKLATPQARILARAIDISWTIGLYYLLSIAFGLDVLQQLTENRGSTHNTGFSVASAGILFFALYMSAVITPEKKKDGKGEIIQSFGQQLIGVRIVDAHDGSPISFRAHYIRISILYAAFLVSQFIFNQTVFEEGVRWEFSWTIAAIPILPIFWSSYRQGWHDNAVGTIVVTEDGQFSIWGNNVRQWKRDTQLSQLWTQIKGRRIPKAQEKSFCKEPYTADNSSSIPTRIYRGVGKRWLVKPIAVAFSLSYYLGFPILGIVFWVDYMRDTSREECYATLDTIYEQIPVEQLGENVIPHTLVEVLISPTLESPDILLEINYLKTVSSNNNCSLRSLDRYADDWADDYQRRLSKRDANPRTIELDEIWSNFPD